MRTAVLAYAGFTAALWAAAIGGGLALYQAAGPGDAIERAAAAHSYNLLSWEVRHLPEKWLYKLGHAFGGSSTDDDDALRRYFSLVAEIDDLSRQPSPPPRLAAAEAERARTENTVEDIIEGRVTAILEQEGLTMGPPPFTSMHIVFPPVDFEFDQPPRVLVISPRDRIEYARSYLLSPGLSMDTVASIEAQAEEGNVGEGGVSALVVDTSGVSTYPSVVSSLDQYESLIDTVFHEWLHQYLLLYPLGRSYFAGSETRTLNESVANIAGHELARLYFQRYGHLGLTGPSGTPGSGAAGNSFDFSKEMRSLRVRVEELLAQGHIAEAEALMAQKRDEFQQHGYYIRRLNQAYFAFHGSYADTPGSIDPIGPKLQELLQRSGSPGEFIRRVRGITSTAGLDHLLAAP
jgi:hypothetical protein